MNLPPPKPSRATPQEQADLDEALKETFPASDPIAPNNVTRIETGAQAQDAHDVHENKIKNTQNHD
jgi:hypothetical protein